MAMTLLCLLMLSLLPATNSQSAMTTCLIKYSINTCSSLYYTIREALLAHNETRYQLMTAFLQKGVFASSELINVLYHVEFTDEAFDSVTNICEGVPSNATLVTSDTPLRLLTAWTNSGVFNIISPLQLSQLQLQIINEILSLYIAPGSGIGLTNNFLWTLYSQNGTLVDLEISNTLSVNMQISQLDCIPDIAAVIASLQDITMILKALAYSEGRLPDIVTEDQIGYVTEPGFQIENTNITLFAQTFPILISLNSFVLGILMLLIVGDLFHILYQHISGDRHQFIFYYTSLSAVAFILNVIIIIFDIYKLPQWCDTEHQVSGKPTVGCNWSSIIKISYEIISIITSFIATIVALKDYIAETERQSWWKVIIHIIASWSIILLLALLTWSVLPTALLMFVYPSVVISLMLLIVATIFWISVIISIPILLVYNIRHKPDCRSILLYLAPVCLLVIILFAAGLMTITYLQGYAFGSGTSGVVGLVTAIVPAISLTLFTEFYRDWFLTRVLGGMNIEDNKKEDETEMEEVHVSNKQIAQEPPPLKRKTKATVYRTNEPKGILERLTSRKEKAINRIQTIQTE